MAATKIDGTAIAKKIRERLRSEIAQVRETNPRFRPSLKIIQGLRSPLLSEVPLLTSTSQWVIAPTLVSSALARSPGTDGQPDANPTGLTATYVRMKLKAAEEVSHSTTLPAHAGH